MQTEARIFLAKELASFHAWCQDSDRKKEPSVPTLYRGPSRQGGGLGPAHTI